MKKFKLLSLIAIASIALAQTGWAGGHGGGGGGHGGGGGGSTAAVLVVDFTGEASAVARSTAVVVSVEDVSAVAVSTAVAFVGDVSAVAVSTAVAFVATVLVITDSLMMSSSAASAFRVGGAGAPVRILRLRLLPVGATTAIMDTADTVTMGGPVTDTAMAADKGISEVVTQGSAR